MRKTARAKTAIAAANIAPLDGDGCTLARAANTIAAAKTPSKAKLDAVIHPAAARATASRTTFSAAGHCRGQDAATTVPKAIQNIAITNGAAIAPADPAAINAAATPAMTATIVAAGSRGLSLVGAGASFRCAAILLQE